MQIFVPKAASLCHNIGSAAGHSLQADALPGRRESILQWDYDADGLVVQFAEFLVAKDFTAPAPGSDRYILGKKVFEILG